MLPEAKRGGKIILDIHLLPLLSFAGTSYCPNLTENQLVKQPGKCNFVEIRAGKGQGGGKEDKQRNHWLPTVLRLDFGYCVKFIHKGDLYLKHKGLVLSYQKISDTSFRLFQTVENKGKFFFHLGKRTVVF